MITPLDSSRFEIPNCPPYIVAFYKDDTRPMLPFTIAVQRNDRPEPEVIHRHLTEPEGWDDYRKLLKYWAARQRGADMAAALRVMID